MGKRPPKYSAGALIKHGLTRGDWPRMWRRPEMRDSYDVVIVGAGLHGLATAYYLAANHGITNVAVVDKGYVGGGGSGRNTAIVRSNYLTPEGVAFYDRSLELYRTMATDLNLNIMFSERGHLTLAHSDSALRTMHWRAEVNKLQGIDSSVIDPQEVKKQAPSLDVSSNTRYPILGALYHKPGAIARHDAVAWAYARGADSYGVEIHQNTKVTDIELRDGRVNGILTDRGYVKTRKVLSAVAGYTPRVLDMVDLTSPIEIFPLQACVTEPIKPWLDTIIVSGSLHLYVSQSSRGEMVMGGAVDPIEVHSQRSTFEFVSDLCDQMLDLFPFLAGIKINRQWAGMADMTPDFAPIMGTTPVEGFYLDAGWGTWGFKATPICGKTMADTMARDRDHDLITEFNLSRFDNYKLVGEKGAAAVGH